MDSNYNEKSKHESNSAVALYKTAVALHGQGKPIDTATALLWSNNHHFSEVFNRVVFGTDLVKPEDLQEASTAEEALIRLRDYSVLTLQRFRDVARAMQNGQILLILGLEDQQLINYEMPFRVMTMDFINYSRQVTLIEEKNRSEFTPSSKENQQAEYIGRFKKTDRLHPVITLVLYYGDDPWDGPLSLSDMLADCPGKQAAQNYGMHLLDVRHMDLALFESFSSDLKAFFGFLRYEHTDQLIDFVKENDTAFQNLPETTLNALIEITKSKQLMEVRDKIRTKDGVANMSEGIELYAKKVADEAVAKVKKDAEKELSDVRANAEKELSDVRASAERAVSDARMKTERKTFIETAKLFHHSIEQTTQAYIDRFHESRMVAEKEVLRYWGSNI